MVDATHISFTANDRSYFSLIKKEIHRIALDAGINEDRINKVDLIVAEMTSNLYKYGDDGEILVGIFPNLGSPYIEIICLDSGPGMINPGRMIQDGMSTSKTLGHGLGSIKRLSDTFELYSQIGWGTILLSRVFSNPEKKVTKTGMIIRQIIVAKPGETISGDGLVHKITDKFVKIMLADGLGHGSEANKAINEAAAAFKIFPDYSPTETLRFIHNSIKKTRGAVITVVGYEFASKMWTATGIGNIATRMISPTTFRNHMPYNGIVGHNIPNSMSEQHYEGNLFNQVMLCSDGIKTRIDLQKYHQINKYDLSVLAAAIYRDHARRNDDMSVVIAKIQ